MKRFAACLLALVLVFSLTPGVFAQTEGQNAGGYDFDTENPGVDYDDMNVENFTYTVVDGEAVITKYTGIGGDVTIPETLRIYPVTAIEVYAFIDCDTLTSVTIPDGVRDIGSFAFSGCDNLTGIWVSEGNANYASDEKGALLNKEKTELFRVPQAIAGSYTIPDSVIGIYDAAFDFCTNLTSVTIPNGVTTIGYSVFNGCVGLRNVMIPDSVTVIRDSVFEACSSLTGIWVSEGNACYSSDEAGVLFNKHKTELMQAPRKGIVGNYTIPDSVITIGRRAFVECTELTGVTIPDSVTTIGDSAFMGCTELTGVTIPDSVMTIGDSAFYSCYRLSNVVIPDGITSIKPGAFLQCYDLTSVTIPDSVTNIGNEAFYGCRNLRKVYYAGTQTQWDAIDIQDDNGYLLEAAIHYNHGPEHSYTPKVTAPTCTAQGFTTYTCSCGDTYKANYVSASAHSYDAGKVTVAATCKAAGVKTYTCKNCSGTKTAAIAKLTTHTYSNSCDTACNVCNAKRTITHSYKTFVTKATLTANGKSVKKCAVCGTVASTTTIPYVWSVKLSATAYTYDGKAKTPTVTVKDSTGKVLTKNVDYTATYASGRTNAGTYKVVITLKGNYTGTKALSFKINPASASKCSIKLYATSYSYTGKAKSPTVIAKNAAGKTLKKGVDYTVTYASGRTKVGTYGVTIKMIGNYTGTKTLTFNIVKAKISTCTVKLSATSYTYNAKTKTPTVTVKSAAGKTLKKGTDYTVSYASGRKAVGTYKVVIKMRGNFTGSKTLTFKIVPKAASINKLTAKSKAILVKLNRVTTQSTGYEIQYSTSSKFTSAKTVTVTSYKTSSKTVSGLKKGKKYYVRVRTYKTVDGKKYYSSWSAYKSVKTK